MAIPERLLLRQKLQRSAREWLKVYREVLNETRPHGLGKDGQAKSRFSPVSANSIASGRAEEAGYEIITNDDGSYDIVFGLPGYILALDQGVRGGRFKDKRKRGGGGSSPFIKSLMDWIETKNIRTELSTLGLAIAIRRSIFNEGIEATNIISIINQRFLEQYGEQIADDYMESMENYIIDNIQRIEERFNK
jgi:hypothetical protein